MSHFSRTDDWHVVNPCTIHHADRMQDGRPFMSTCVPKALYLTLKNLKVRCSSEWSGDQIGRFFMEDEAGKFRKPAAREHFDLDAVIFAEAELDDTITVFSIPGGAIGRFSRIASVLIKGIEKGKVGGDYNATASTGISYSGMSSREVPAEGLMAGEPGGLYYIDDTDGEYKHDLKGQRYLALDLYMDRDQLLAFCDQILKSRSPVVAAAATVNAELFEHEVDATFAEPWHRHDYGLLSENKKYSTPQVPARLHNIRVDFGLTAAPQSKGDEEEAEGIRTPITSAATYSDGAASPAAYSNKELVKVVRRYSRIITAIGVAIFLVLLLKR